MHPSAILFRVFLLSFGIVISKSSSTYLMTRRLMANRKFQDFKTGNRNLFSKYQIPIGIAVVMQSMKLIFYIYQDQQDIKEKSRLKLLCIEQSQTQQSHMSALIRKKTSKIQNQLKKIAIVDQLRKNKSSVIYRKFLISIVSATFNKSQILRVNSDQSVKMIFITQGSVKYNLSISMQKRQVKSPNYIVFDRQIQYAVVLQDNTVISQLPQKHMYQYFQGIVQFPILSQKLNFLKQISLFKQLNRKSLLKICIQTIELDLVIGGTVYKQDQEAEFLFIIVRGQVVFIRNNKRISYIGANQVFGHPKTQTISSKVTKTKQLRLNQQDQNKTKRNLQENHNVFSKHSKTEQVQEQQSCIQLYQQSAKVISDRAIIYKISRSMLQPASNTLDSPNLSSTYTKPIQKKPHTNQIDNSTIKKMKWRQQRLNCDLNLQKKSLQVKNRKEKISFIEKHTILSSFYNSESQLTPRTVQFHKMISNEKKYNSQEQYYDIALKKLKKLREQKYGEGFQTKIATVFFPMKIEKKFMKRFQTQASTPNKSRSQTISYSTKSQRKQMQTKRALNLVKMWKHNFKASKGV